MTSRHRFVALLLPVCLLSWAASSPAAAAGSQEQPSSQELLADSNGLEHAGETLTGIAGITETVDQIMARATGVPELLRLPQPTAPPLAAERPQNPLAPAVSRWPLAPPAGASAVGPQVPAGRSPQTPVVSFEAIVLAESGALRPDTVGDVGPTQVLVATTGRIKVFDKAGNPGPLDVTSDAFFQSVRTTSTTDLHVRYDRLSGRWFVTSQTLECPDDFILLAVSSGPTITGTSSFTFFRFLAEPGRRVEDQSLGVDANAVYIGGQMFNCGGQPVSASGFVIRKADLFSSILTVTAFRSLGDIHVPLGVDNDDPAATEGYFIGTDIAVLGRLQIVRVTNPGTLTPTITQLALNVPATALPINQPQPGGPAIASGGDRLLAAAIRRNKIAGATTLWTAHAIQVDSAGVASVTGGRNGARWYEISGLATTPVVVQAGTLFDGAAATPFGFWMPAVAASGQGHMALGASRASASAAAGGFASVAAAGRLRTDPLGSTQAATLVQGSTFVYDSPDPAPEPWGRSSQTVVDPVDDQTMWTFQEYANATNSWAVRAVKLWAPPPVTPTTATPATVPQGVASVNVVVTGTSVAGSEFFDPGADPGGPGYTSRIAAAIGGGVVVNSVTFGSPVQVTLNVSTVGATGGPQDVTITNPDGQSATGNGLLTVVSCPVITVEPAVVAAGATGTPYSQTFTQSGGTPPVTFGLAGTLPAGLTFDGTTGVLSGTPSQTGSFDFTVSVTDANACTGSRDYTLVIDCATITVDPATIPNGTGGSPYSQTFTQTGGIGTITWALTGTLPTSLTFDTATGVLSGTPTQTGSFPITVTATDANGCIGSRTYTLVIDCGTITVNPATIPNGTAGSAYSQVFTQTGGIGTITWALTGTLPTGLTFDPATGALSGTPTETGSFSITVTATDANGCVGSRTYTLTIDCQTITVDPATVPDGTAGSPYSQTFTQTGGIGTITWALTGTLPTGLTFDTATGVLSGTPTQTGSFPITVTATDANGCIGSRTYTLVIDCGTITVNPATIPDGTAGSPYSQTFTQTGGIGTITWALTGTLPTGLTFDTATGILSGTPVQLGSFPTTVTATDANGCTGSRGYTLVVAPAGPFVPTALLVDQAANRVFEAGETAIVAPAWRNDTGAPQPLTGDASLFTGPGSSTYTIADATADYGAIVPAGGAANCSTTTGDCYAFNVSVPAARPTLHWDSTYGETLSSGDTKTWTLHIGDSFDDVPRTSAFYRFVETLLHKAITGGCGDGVYCPVGSTLREQMAVFVLVAREGPGYAPAACTTPMFSDVPASSPFCRFIEELARRGVVTGCAPGQYCPHSAVTREQMAVFALRTLDPTLNPPACTATMFNDVPASSPFCKWIEELARRGVVTGCGGGAYCPTEPVTREQMGVFITVTFGLALYGP